MKEGGERDRAKIETQYAGYGIEALEGMNAGWTQIGSALLMHPFHVPVPMYHISTSYQSNIPKKYTARHYF